MATVTFELDDAIYRKAEEMLSSQGMSMEAFLKAGVESMVMAMATGDIPVPGPEMQAAVDKIVGRARRLSSESGQ